MQLIYSVCVLHLQSDHIYYSEKYLIMLIQQFSALVKLVEYENRENSSCSAKHHICVPLKYKYTVKCTT
jgi:hypothetical protein